MAEPRSQNKLVRWINHRLPVFSYLEHELHDYPTPRNLSYWWNFGSLAGILLVIMIVTGVVLAMQYTPDMGLAFNSVERIMRDVNYGWLLRYIHMNGASFFFIVTYIHVFRGLYFGSYKEPRAVVDARRRHSAPDDGDRLHGLCAAVGQMSFWGATVITNLFSAIPGVGNDIVAWLWGGFAIGDPTLNRSFSLHYLLPFVIVGVVMLHLLALHQHGSNNPLGIDRKGAAGQHSLPPLLHDPGHVRARRVPDRRSIFVFYMPNVLGDPQNYIPANPLQTPPEIVPEWYFLPYYAILRSIPNKLLGVCAMFGSIGTLFLVPWLDTSRIRSAFFRPIYKWVFWLLVIDCFVLGWVGAHRPEGWHRDRPHRHDLLLLHFFVLMPLIGKIERPLPLPTSITAAVMANRQGAARPAAEKRDAPHRHRRLPPPSCSPSPRRCGAG